MRLTDEQIKQAIVHEERLVRSVALEHFSESYSQDPSVMPLAIQAVEEYGWNNVVHHYFHSFSDLVVTSESAAWIVDRLQQRAESPVERWRSFRGALLASLLDADVEVLRPLEDQILRLDALDESGRELLDLRLQWSTRSSQACWAELESLARECASPDREKFPSAEIRRAEAVISVFAPRADEFVGRALDLLALTLGDEATDPRLWLQGMIIILVGRMRLAEAAPLLVQRLYDDWDWYGEECQNSLKRINGNAALDAICDDYATRPWHVRLFAIGALEHLRAEGATQPLSRLAEMERRFAEQGDESSLLLSGICQALTHQFETPALHLARELINEYDDDPEIQWIRRDVVAASLMMGEPIPELDEWKWIVEREMKRQESWYTSVPHFLRPRKPLPAAPSILDATEEDADPLATAAPRTSQTTVRPVTRTAARVGRNDPCPCGSGKKYKKCCLRRDFGAAE